MMSLGQLNCSTEVTSLMSENLSRYFRSLSTKYLNLIVCLQIWTEVQSGEGSVNFITGAGGFLQVSLETKKANKNNKHKQMES